MTNRTNMPWWKKDGLSVSGGWHPLSARIRAGDVADNEEELYEWEYSEERVLRLKKLGINLIIGQFDRGLGDTDQREEQERAKQLAELCHRHGLRHGTYMANTIYFESVMKDNPDCESWVVHTHDGRLVNFGGEQSWRWVACFNSRRWRQRVRRQIKKAITYVHTDLLHFDNLAVWPEPDSCHCKYCQEKFRQFLRDRYPTEKDQKARFGFTGFDTFCAPSFYLRFIKPWDIDRITNPLMQEWIEFRCHTVTDYIREMSDCARALKTDIAIDSNGQSIWSANQAFLYGSNSTAQASHVDIVIEENPDLRPDRDADAIPPSTVKMRGMNLMRRLGKSYLTSYHDEEELAFNLTFCGNPGVNTHWGYAEPRKMVLQEAQPRVTPLLNQFNNHKDIYCGLRPLARTTVWRNQRSLAWIAFDTHLSACVTEHVLFQRRIPFSIVQDERITEEGLAAFDLVILPNVEYISDEQRDALASFVERGGTLLITERSGAYDGHARRRSRSAFEPLFRGSPEIPGDLSATAYHGKGRVAYLSRIHYKYPPRTFKSRHHLQYDTIDSRYWKEPHNVNELLGLIAWLKPDFQPIKVCGHPEVRLDWVDFGSGSEGCLLMRCGGPLAPDDLRLCVRTDAKPRDALLYVPDRPEPVRLTWVGSGAYCETLLPGVVRHAVVKYTRE